MKKIPIIITNTKKNKATNSLAAKEKVSKTIVLPTTAKWEGVTYKEDKEEVVNAINEMVRTKKYNKNLWG